MFYLVTMKNPGRPPKYHEKEVGACRMSPTCTDVEGAHHTFLAEAPNMDVIFATALKEGMHITRVEEVFHVRKYEGADVSVRDDADRRLPGSFIATGLTEFDLNAVPGIQSLPRGDRPRTGRGTVESISPDFFNKYSALGVEIAGLLNADLDSSSNSDTGDDGSGGATEVSGTRGGEQRLEDRVAEVEGPEGEFRIGPAGNYGGE